MLACDRIRILAVFSSGKVIAKSKNTFVFLTGYMWYENHNSSCRGFHFDEKRRLLTFGIFLNGPLRASGARVQKSCVGGFAYAGCNVDWLDAFT